RATCAWSSCYRAWCAMARRSSTATSSRPRARTAPSSATGSISSPGFPAGSTTACASIRGTSCSPIRSRWASPPGFNSARRTELRPFGEQREGARPQRIWVAHAAAGRGGVEQQVPAAGGKREVDGFRAGVDQQEQVVALDRRAALVALGEPAAEEQHAERA